MMIIHQFFKLLFCMLKRKVGRPLPLSCTNKTAGSPTTIALTKMQSMATLASSSSLLLSSPPSNFSPPSLSSAPRLSLPSFSHSNALSSSLSISLPFLTYPTSSKRFAPSALSVRASATEKKKVLIVNTNSGGHAIIGFYFAKELLGSGHEVTILTVGEESSDKMKKPPFNRFSVKIHSKLITNICVCVSLSLLFQYGFLVICNGYNDSL